MRNPFRRQVASPPGARGANGSNPQPKLDAADRLVADGHYRDAIDLLSDTNRVRRDPRTEQRLVDLRSEAFQQLEWPTERPAWPDAVPDLFPGAQIPETPAADLTVEHIRSAITHHGSLIVRGLVDEPRVQRLVHDIDQALAGYDAVTGGDHGATSEWYRRFTRDGISDRATKRTRGAVMMVESPPAIFDLLDTFDAVGLRQILCDYFGEPPMLLARKGTLRRIEHGGDNGGWHQDGAFMGTDIRSINVWLALTHCGDTAPGLDVVARRLDHIVQTGDGAFTAWATSPKAAEDAAAGAIVRPIFDAGDVLIFDHMNLHRTAIAPGHGAGPVRDRDLAVRPVDVRGDDRPGRRGYARVPIPILF